MVLRGNMATAASMRTIGRSTGGWSNVGIGLASSLNTELDFLLSNVTARLTDTMSQILMVQKGLDLLLGQAGNATDDTVTNLLANSTAYTPTRRSFAAGLHQVQPGLQPVHRPVPPAVADRPIPSAFAKPVPTPAPLVDVDKHLENWDEHTDLAENIKKFYAKRLREVAENFEMPTTEEVKDAAKYALAYTVENKLMPQVNSKLQEFLVIVEPALAQVGVWLETFGDKIQASLETFTTSMDLVQRIFDSLMSKATPGGEGEEQMQYDTYTLFCISGNPTISVQDLEDVSSTYGIEALGGTKAAELHAKYDEDSNGQINKAEYARFVNDESIPGSMSVVLRVYASKLSVISGNLAAAKMRDELSGRVVDYLTLIAAKNMTKLAWVSNRLTNGSIPMEFTADVLQAFAMGIDNPDKLTNTDVGQIVMTEMYKQEPDYVRQCVDMMSEPDFWVSEGFDLQDQPICISRVTTWFEAAEAEHPKKGLSLHVLGALQNESLRLLSLPALKATSSAERSALVVRQRGRAFRTKRRAQHASELRSYYTSSTSRVLRDQLLGGVAASCNSNDPATEMALNSGQPAVPATLEFAKFLSWNASDASNTFQKQCFAHSATSGSALDSFSNKIKGMVKKISTFLDQMKEYSTPQGIKRLEDTVAKAVDDGAAQVINVLNGQIDIALDAAYPVVADAVQKKIDEVVPAVADKLDEFDLPKSDEIPPVVVDQLHDRFDPAKSLLKRRSGVKAVAVRAEPPNPVVLLSTLLGNLQAILPDVIKNLKDARQQVSAASEQMKSTFNTFKEKGPPIFDQVAALYSSLWTAYFTLFATLTLSILVYGFYSSGMLCELGGSSSDDAGYEEPVGLVARLSVCYSACTSCLSACTGSSMCFWSFLIFMQVICLVLFIVAIILCLVTGLQAFMNAGCAGIYIINDGQVCGSAMESLQVFLSTFLQNGPALAVTCDAETLLACKVIGNEIKDSATGIVVGGLMAAVFTFQLIIESAILHERARWLRIFGDEAGKTA